MASQQHPRLSRTSTPQRLSEGASAGYLAPSLPLPPNPRRLSHTTPGRVQGLPAKPVQLCVSVCDAPLSLVLRVEHPLPGIPEEVRVHVVKRLQQAGTDVEQSAAALAEIEALDKHRAVGLSPGLIDACAALLAASSWGHNIGSIYVESANAVHHAYTCHVAQLLAGRTPNKWRTSVANPSHKLWLQVARRQLLVQLPATAATTARRRGYFWESLKIH
eukprot:226502-Pelagomonas_calceolata.AAC.4